MKRTWQVVLAAAAVALLWSCSQASDNKDDDSTDGTGGTGTTTVSNYKASIDFPKSILASDEASKSARLFRVAEDSSYAYRFVKDAMEQLVDQAGTNATMGVQYFAVIDQNKLTPSSATHSGLKVKITQEMMDAMKSAVPEAAVDSLEIDFAVGDEIPVPDFVYNTSSNSNFDFSVTMTQTEAGMTMANTFYWKSDLSRTAMDFDVSMDMDIDGTVISTKTKGKMAFDSATQSAYMSFNMSGLGDSGDMEFVVKAKVDSDNATAHGVTLSQTFSMSGADSSLTAYADDNGGMVINSYTSGDDTFTYTEGFTGTGTVDYQKVGDTVNSGTANATYAAKLDPLPTDFGAAPGFFD